MYYLISLHSTVLYVYVMWVYIDCLFPFLITTWWPHLLTGDSYIYKIIHYAIKLIMTTGFGNISIFLPLGYAASTLQKFSYFNNIACTIYCRILSHNVQHYVVQCTNYIYTNNYYICMYYWNPQIHTNREVLYQMLMQFLMVHMFYDAVLCLY